MAIITHALKDPPILLCLRGKNTSNIKIFSEQRICDVLINTANDAMQYIFHFTPNVGNVTNNHDAWPDYRCNWKYRHICLL